MAKVSSKYIIRGAKAPTKHKKHTHIHKNKQLSLGVNLIGIIFAFCVFVVGKHR